MVPIRWIHARLRAIVRPMRRAASATPPAPVHSRSRSRSRTRSWPRPRVVVTAGLLAALAVLAAGCKVREPPPIERSYVDDFERGGLGPDYNRTGSGYRIADGALNARGARNHPLWLARKLPPGDLQIELDAWSTSPDGDIKVEVYGDGRSFDPDGNRYKATGYVLVFGGWKNSKSIIARMDEHGDEMATRTQPRVVPNQRYRWRIVRRGNTIEWFIDDMTTPFLRFEDPQPLTGRGHEYFGFNNWEADTWFDNLVIKRL